MTISYNLIFLISLVVVILVFVILRIFYHDVSDGNDLHADGS